MRFAESKPLAGQVALVTGASAGIGRGIAHLFGAAGAAVGVNYLADEAGAAAVVAEIERAGGRALACRADVSEEAAVERMFDSLLDRFGRLDILIGNAGIQKDSAFDAMSLADWQAVLAVNLTGQFLCARRAVRIFLAQAPAPHARARGKIVFISSVHEVIPWACRVNYAASKGGLSLMMKSLAQEVAGRGIRVNAIAPGAIRTDINRAAWETPEAEAELVGLIPYGRIGEPADVAAAALWLSSEESDYVTGTTLFVDGGMTLYPAFIDAG